MPNTAEATADIEKEESIEVPRAAGRSRFDLMKYGPYLAAFLIPVLVMVIVFIERGIWPFGDQCFLRTDLYHQYAPFFQELKYKLSHGGSMMYSWNIGSGTSFIPIIAYYLSSPANIFLFLCPAKYIIEFITALIVIKSGLASVSMTFYLNRKHKNEGMSAWPPVAFGIFYALSGYMAAYSWNVMWLDCIWLFPIVILGVEQMFKETAAFYTAWPSGSRSLRTITLPSWSASASSSTASSSWRPNAACAGISG